MFATHHYGAGIVKRVISFPNKCERCSKGVYTMRYHGKDLPANSVFSQTVSYLEYDLGVKVFVPLVP